MYLIQSGEVEIVTKFGNGKEFIIEKLFRGSIINHNSFLMDDGIDTDAICRKPVTLFYIDIDTITKLRKKYPDCESILFKHEMKLVDPKTEEPVIDYIIKDPNARKYFLKNPKTKEIIHNHEKEEHVNKLTVKLKNAIMFHWTKI